MALSPAGTRQDAFSTKAAAPCQVARKNAGGLSVAFDAIYGRVAAPASIVSPTDPLALSSDGRWQRVQLGRSSRKVS